MKHFHPIFKSIICTILVCLVTISSAQTTLYVNPDTPSGTMDGSLAAPYTDIASTVDLVEAAGGGDVIIINGEYDMTDREVDISTTATQTTAVTIKPQSTAGVKLIFNGRSGFTFQTSASYITLEGLELDGQTNELEYWSVVASGFWGDETVERNGGLAIILDGQHITIKDNYIHDWYQKAVEIRDGRYVVVQGNIIHDIAVTSLTGGHGVMRQQKGKEFFDNDLAGVYRWDIKENLIFNVEQTIYSWVPSKGFIEMVIDEGKSILIDDPKDSDGNQEQMSARIKNNVVAFGSVDHIRLKSTPNLEVSNNSIYSQKVNANGISDKQGDTNTPQFLNFICHNNASQTVATVAAIEIDKAVEQTTNAGGTPVVTGNYAMDGLVKPNGQTGITKLTSDNLFINPEGGNFRINPALGLPATTGVESEVLDSIDSKINRFAVSIIPSTLDVDHLKLSQTILDNIPGLNDGIAGNENVFADYGTMSVNYHMITFDVVNGTWKTNTGSPGKQKFELNEVYYTWYETIATTYLNSSGLEYERIRWGDSRIKQNQVFDPDWLTVCQIKSNRNTLINGYTNDFIVDGDILIDFENFTPSDGDSFNLIKAKTITTNNTTDLFDRVLFEGYTPTDYSLDVITVGNKQVVRLTIGNCVETWSDLYEATCTDYTWTNTGLTYTETGVYYDTLTNATNCDSIVRLNLTVNTASFYKDTLKTCKPYNWDVNNTTYTTSGLYYHTIPNAAGCDSIISLELTITPLDLTITKNLFPEGVNLSAVEGYTSYQWLDCNNAMQAIPDETNYDYTPIQNGTYAVIINDGTCTDTSDCVLVTGVGIEPYNSSLNIQAYPNPFTNKISIENTLKKDVKIYSLEGKEIRFKTLKPSKSGTLIIDTQSFESGVYILQIKNTTKRLIKL